MFFELRYWSKLKLRHNLDVMHVEKNVFDTLVGTILDIEGKTKDTIKARLDLERMGTRRGLWMNRDNDKARRDLAFFSMKPNDKKEFLKFVSSVKFPDGYASNIARCVNVDGGKFTGLKSHDCHVFMQHLLPVGIRHLLPEDTFWRNTFNLRFPKHDLTDMRNLISEQVAGHTQQDLTYLRMDRASGSIAHPPYFDGNNYGAWKAKMKSFLWSLDERVWSTVVHGFPKPTKTIGKGDEETTVLKTREEWTTAEVTHSTNNQKGLNALFTAVSSDQFEYISACDTSKEAWDILQVTHEGTDTVKGAKLQMHTLQFETLTMDENETFSEFYAKLCVIVNACSGLGEKIPEDRVVKKILRSLPQRFQPKITAIEEIRDLNTLKVQELIVHTNL
ncbi:unnamed protein product [Prunus armeniaca]